MRDKLQETFTDELPSGTAELGYIHGNQKVSIFEYKDLQAMYKLFSTGSRITFCFYQKIHGCECSKAESRKREVMDDSGSDSSEEIFQEKHPMMKIPKL